MEINTKTCEWLSFEESWGTEAQSFHLETEILLLYIYIKSIVPMRQNSVSLPADTLSSNNIGDTVNRFCSCQWGLYQLTLRENSLVGLI